MNSVSFWRVNVFWTLSETSKFEIQKTKIVSETFCGDDELIELWIWRPCAMPTVHTEFLQLLTECTTSTLLQILKCMSENNHLKVGKAIASLFIKYTLA